MIIDFVRVRLLRLLVDRLGLGERERSSVAFYCACTGCYPGHRHASTLASGSTSSTIMAQLSGCNTSSSPPSSTRRGFSAGSVGFAPSGPSVSASNLPLRHIVAMWPAVSEVQRWINLLRIRGPRAAPWDGKTVAVVSGQWCWHFTRESVLVSRSQDDRCASRRMAQRVKVTTAAVVSSKLIASSAIAPCEYAGLIYQLGL